MTRVLLVCTGNVCRSPAAEMLLRASLAVSASDVVVSSAGTAALEGEPVDPRMAAMIRASGGEPAPFSARQLRLEQVRGAELVLVMTRQHRSAVVRLEPAAVRRTLLLVEAAALATAVRSSGWPAGVPANPASRLAALPRLAAAHRSSMALPGDAEVVDPYRREPALYSCAMRQIEAAVASLVEAVR